ncbi:MAG: bifunctional diguanylate cyclase/phosphodiesterase [Bacillota bacterium]|nr:MAG: bifunctional diguanylate cyclase/phosphodiesterase [Bacillota bacterium]
MDNKPKKKSELNATETSLKIIVFYVIIGFTWILLSDQVIKLFTTDPEDLEIIQSVKGIFYVAITALVFYYIIHRQLDLYVNTIQTLKKAYIDLDEGHNKSVKLENKLFQIAYYDELTGLPNKFMLEEKITSYIESHPKDALIGFIYFDIDEFRNINEVKGHAVGDYLIKSVADLLKEKIEEPNILARMGGDEFVIAVFSLQSLDVFMTTIEAYLASIRKTFILDEDHFFITYSAGVALYPDHGKDYLTLFRHADAAMSMAKAKGKDQIVIFDDEMVLLIKQQTEILTQLRTAIQHNEFSLHYQPILSLTHDDVIAVEALIRWNHPTKGFIPPLEFISLAEKNGFIKDITEWVFKEAARQYKAWPIERKSFRISINISAVMLMQDNFIPNLSKWISEDNIDCSKFTLEITETAVIHDIQKSIHVIKQLKRYGFSIALDDFGTGYSSLTYLQKLPIDTIKIDRSFISSITESTDDFHVLRYMVELAHHLKLEVVAEGIETPEQIQMIKSYFVDYAQGYYFCKPMPQTRVLEYFKMLEQVKKEK